MSKYISQYDEVVSSDSTDYYLLQRGTAYKKFTKANFFNQISNELGIGATTLVGLDDVDITYLSNGDTLQYNSSTEMWECVPMGGGGGAVAMDDLSDVTITGLATNDVISWNGSAYVNNATYARVSSVTTGFIPRSTGTNTFTNGIMTDDGTAVGFNTATYTYSFNFGGNSARSLGLVRHTTSNTAGSTFSLYAGGATSGASDKNGGNFDIYSGISTGTGTSQFNVYTCSAGSSGTTSVTPTVKLNINGAGTAEFTTTNANSKMRFGHNLKSICGVTTNGGLEIARTDGTYVLCPSIYSGSDYNMYFGGGNGARAFSFVTNPATDTVPAVILGGTYGGIQAGVGISGTYMYQFHRTWNNLGASTSMYVSTSGTNTNAGTNVALLELVNTATNVNGSNFGLQISVTGASTGTNQNIALSTTNGKVVFYGQKGDYDVSFGATANRTFGINREVVPATAGRSLTLYGGSAVLAGTNLAGGNVCVETGTGTGSSGADFIVKTSTPGSSGTTDNAPTTKFTVKGSGVINMSALPTSASGLSAGDLWNNLGVVSIV